MTKPKRPTPSIDDVDAVRDVGARAHYDDPVYYDRAYRRRRQDVEYYLQVAKRWGGPVLEYGVGSGRVALELARAGFDVTGVDLSRPMLDQLAKRLEKEPEAVRQRLRMREGDMRTLDLRRRFPLVIAPFNVVLHLYERQDVEAFLAKVKRHLASGGRFVFDFSVPVPADLALDPNRSYRAPSFVHPRTKQRMRYSERFEYHPLRQMLVVWMEMMPEDGGDPWVIPLSHRQFFPQEMETLLHYNGFADFSVTEDFSDEPASPLADALVISCRVAGAKKRRSGRGSERTRRRA